MKILIGSFLLILLAACSNNTDKPDLIEQGTMHTSEPKDTCLCDQLTEDSLKTLYKETQLFTGVCIYNYPSTDQKYMVKSILNGKLHGTITYYDKMGEKLMEVIYENGIKKRSGNDAPLSCDCTELETLSAPGEEVSRSFLDEIPFTGTCFEKYPNTDQTYTEITYKKGLLEGYTTFYDKQGKTMYIEKYEKGKLIKIITN